MSEELVRAPAKLYDASEDVLTDFPEALRSPTRRVDIGALPHRKSSFVRFKHLFSSDSVLVSPPRPQLRSSALEQEKNTAYTLERKRKIYHEANRGGVCRLSTPIARCTFPEEGSVEKSLSYQARREVLQQAASQYREASSSQNWNAANRICAKGSAAVIFLA